MSSTLENSGILQKEKVTELLQMHITGQIGEKSSEIDLEV